MIRLFRNIFQYIRTYRKAYQLDRLIVRNHPNEFEGLVGALRSVKPKQDLSQLNMTFRYLNASKTPVSRFGFVLKAFEVGVASVGLILLMTLVASSQPGGKFYTYKTVARQFSIQLSPSPQDRILASIELAESTLSDTKQVVESPKSSLERKTAALAVSTKQTQSAIQKISQDEDLNKNLPEKKALLEKLAVLALDQLELAKQVSVTQEELPEEQIESQPDVVKQARETAETVAVLKKTISEATGQDDTPAKLTEGEGDLTVSTGGENSSPDTAKKSVIIPKQGPVGGVVEEGVVEEDLTKTSSVKAGFIPEPLSE